jgi:ABC-2 type transport system ATP-binding protein
LLGPNGAGKTTTIEILEGLTMPDGGEVEILGTPWREGAAGRALRDRLGIQLQETQLADKLTVTETLALRRSTSNTYRRACCARRARAQRPRRHLSGGQKRRLAVACALVSKPERLSRRADQGLDAVPAPALGDHSPVQTPGAPSC